MNLYTNNIWRWTINLLYPSIIFVFQSWGPILDSWTGPILFVALFCFLWSDVKDLFVSTGLTWFIAIPCWWYLIERPKPSFGAEHFAAHLWLIVLMYIVFVLIPQTLILTTRLRVMHYYKK
ncbi:hypothetical protein J3D43_003425 [Paenibacillus xylanexedens]|uniref:hypothetical protein n=1 Tax=Paenibacillus xylanexedens TaxID=528191 RepID=UPI00209F155C|nr:hypothetical protein [Paenibacillus xylanexedens]MCP1424909.1 hypothetical protein [Paenibacillus xylanexedens]